MKGPPPPLLFNRREELKCLLLHGGSARESISLCCEGSRTKYQDSWQTSEWAVTGGLRSPPPQSLSGCLVFNSDLFFCIGMGAVHGGGAGRKNPGNKDNLRNLCRSLCSGKPPLSRLLLCLSLCV